MNSLDLSSLSLSCTLSDRRRRSLGSRIDGTDRVDGSFEGEEGGSVEGGGGHNRI